MAYKILYTHEALVDLEILIDHIRADNPAAAERFGTDLLNHVELLRDLPWLGMPVRGRATVRKLLHSPVRVYYRILDDRKLVEVLHFWHASRRDPDDF